MSDDIPDLNYFKETDLTLHKPDSKHAFWYSDYDNVHLASYLTNQLSEFVSQRTDMRIDDTSHINWCLAHDSKHQPHGNTVFQPLSHFYTSNHETIQFQSEPNTKINFSVVCTPIDKSHQGLYSLDNTSTTVQSLMDTTTQECSGNLQRKKNRKHNVRRFTNARKTKQDKERRLLKCTTSLNIHNGCKIPCVKTIHKPTSLNRNQCNTEYKDIHLLCVQKNQYNEIPLGRSKKLRHVIGEIVHSSLNMKHVFAAFVEDVYLRIRDRKEIFLQSSNVFYGERSVKNWLHCLKQPPIEATPLANIALLVHHKSLSSLLDVDRGWKIKHEFLNSGSCDTATYYTNGNQNRKHFNVTIIEHRARDFTFSIGFRVKRKHYTFKAI